MEINHESRYSYVGTVGETDYFIAQCSCGWMSGNEYEDGIRSRTAAQNSWQRHVASWFNNAVPPKTKEERRELSIENSNEEPKLPMWLQGGPPDLHDPNKEYVPTTHWPDVFTTPISMASVKSARRNCKRCGKGFNKYEQEAGIDHCKDCQRDIKTMPSIKLPTIVHRKLDIPLSDSVQNATKELHESGYSSLVVGGAVRDALLRRRNKDVDFEVHPKNNDGSSISYDTLVNILGKHGNVNVVGRQFAVAKFTDDEGNDYDFSLPRRDSATGIGHKDFDISTGPMSKKEASERRDFSINAFMYDPTSHNLYDFHNGLDDLKNKHIRMVGSSETHNEDGLRIVRAARFAAQLGFTLHPDTARSYQRDYKDESYTALPKDRIREEWRKIFASDYPGNGLQAIKDSGLIKHYPELASMPGIPQDKEYHPEEDLWNHVVQSTNMSSRLAKHLGLSDDEKIVRNMAVVCHDFGKPETTELTNGRWTSKGHAQVGERHARTFLDSIGASKYEQDVAAACTRNHMRDLDFNESSRPKQVNKLADDMAPGNIKQLIHVMNSDFQGRTKPGDSPPEVTSERPGVRHIRRLADESKVSEAPMVGHIRGQDLIDELGWSQGPAIGKAVSLATEAQKNEEFSTRDEAVQWLHDNKDKLNNINSSINKSGTNKIEWKKKWKRIRKVKNLPNKNNCPGCGRVINYMGLCNTCREKAGLTRHHWWSQHSQEGNT